MAFTWSALNKGDMPKKNDIDEVVSKINSILNALDKGLDFPYTEFAQRGSMYDYERHIALRQVIDNLDAIKCNDCSSYNAFEKSAACPLAKSGYCSADNGPFHGSVFDTEKTGDNLTHKSNELYANNATVDNTVYTTADTGNYSGHDGMDDATEHYSADKGYDNTVCKAVGNCDLHDANAYIGYNGADNDAECGAHYGNQYASENSSFDSGENTGNNAENDTGVYSTNYISDDVTYDVAFCLTHFGTEHIDYGSANDFSVYGTHYSGDDRTFNSGENKSNLADCSTHFRAEKFVAGTCSTDNLSYDSTYKYGYDSTYDSGVDNSYDATVYDLENAGYDGVYDSGYDRTYDYGVKSSNFRSVIR